MPGEKDTCAGLVHIQYKMYHPIEWVGRCSNQVRFWCHNQNAELRWVPHTTKDIHTIVPNRFLSPPPSLTNDSAILVSLHICPRIKNTNSHLSFPSPIPTPKMWDDCADTRQVFILVLIILLQGPKSGLQRIFDWWWKRRWGREIDPQRLGWSLQRQINIG